jgi:hypothetical protein
VVLFRIKEDDDVELDGKDTYKILFKKLHQALKTETKKGDGYRSKDCLSRKLK